MTRLSAYTIINLVLLGVLSFLIAFLLTSPWHEITFPCLVRKLTGAACPTCGFSLALLEWLRGDRAVEKVPPELLSVLLFFGVQWLLRIAALYAGRSLKAAVIRIDIAVSFILFLLAFLPLYI